jgi:Carboxypeptidase regulatory-like domain
MFCRQRQVYQGDRPVTFLVGKLQVFSRTWARASATIAGMTSRLTFGICSLALVGSVSAQSDLTSLTGTVSEPAGATVAEAPVQIKNNTTGAIARALSNYNGRYTFNGLAAGSYVFSIVMPGFAFERINRDIILEAGRALVLNIRLTETVNGSTLGDDPARLAQVIRKRAKVPPGPAPRDAAGRPDLSGVWVVMDDPYPEQP